MTRSITNESTWTARRCAACQPGKHSDSATGMICLPCLPGQYAESTASASCDACPPGKLNTAVSSGSCQECPTGGFCGSATVNSEQCPAGSYNPTVGATNSSFCLKCEAGKASSVSSHCALRHSFLLLTTYYLLLTAYYLLLTTYYVLLTRCREVPQPLRVSTASQGAWLTLKAVWFAPDASPASTKARLEPQRARARASAAPFARRAQGRRCRAVGGRTRVPLTSAALLSARPRTQAFTHRRVARSRHPAAPAPSLPAQA